MSYSESSGQDFLYTDAAEQLMLIDQKLYKIRSKQKLTQRPNIHELKDLIGKIDLNKLESEEKEVMQLRSKIIDKQKHQRWIEYVARKQYEGDTIIRIAKKLKLKFGKNHSALLSVVGGNVVKTFLLHDNDIAERHTAYLSIGELRNELSNIVDSLNPEAQQEILNDFVYVYCITDKQRKYSVMKIKL